MVCFLVSLPLSLLDDEFRDAGELLCFSKKGPVVVYWDRAGSEGEEWI
jgi:hypothetical protein